MKYELDVYIELPERKVKNMFHSLQPPKSTLALVL